MSAITFTGSREPTRRPASRRPREPLAPRLATAAALGIGAVVLGGLGAQAGPKPAAAAAGGLACLLLFLVRPWTVLPVLIVLGEIVEYVLHISDVTSVVALHGGIVGLAFASIAIRKLRGVQIGRIATRADGMALLLGMFVLVWGGLGLAAAHNAHQVIVAGYELGVAPLYYLLATLTLTTREALWRALKLYFAGALLIAAFTFAGPAHAGGLLSGYALVVLASLAACDQLVRRRLALIAVAMPLFAADVALSGFRSVWLYTAVGLVLVFLRTVARRPAVIHSAALLVLAGVAAVVLSSTIAPDRAAFATQHAAASLGYRVSESDIALGLVEVHPLVGFGLGQQANDRFLDGFGYKSVGPILHSYWLTLAINGGIVMVGLVILFLLTVLRGGRWQPRGPDGAREMAVAFGARYLVFGTALAAQFAGPTDGHWELGLMVGLALVAEHHARAAATP